MEKHTYIIGRERSHTSQTRVSHLGSSNDECKVPAKITALQLLFCAAELNLHVELRTITGRSWLTGSTSEGVSERTCQHGAAVTRETDAADTASQTAANGSDIPIHPEMKCNKALGHT